MVESIPPRITYGPIVHGSKKRVTKSPRVNAPNAEVILLITFCTLGLKNIGISVATLPGLYLIKSFISSKPKSSATNPKPL